MTKALTQEKENFCLYGFPSEQWRSIYLLKKSPPELPEPALGSYGRIGFDKNERNRLFTLMNGLQQSLKLLLEL
ncbi:hypothetical protein C5167_031409 [Papaver somniferum]|uniref:PHD finger protein ALFIN-LIKE n=1 Tax=Papaver somniferum TaxID=3469 RepID=A0A4Y7K829_PAPSO|nr:hypothetical protein C5167_031409 [Papaver somniferum]